MPRLPVDGKKVQEIRFTLGTFERERLDTLITGITFNRVANPIVSLMGDPVALAALGVGLLALFPSITEALPDNYQDIISGMSPAEIQSWYQDVTSGGAPVGGGIGALIGLFFGGPLGAAVGGVGGAYAGEATEDFVENLYTNPDNTRISSVQLSIISLLLSAKRKVL